MVSKITLNAQHQGLVGRDCRLTAVLSGIWSRREIEEGMEACYKPSESHGQSPWTT